MAVGVGLNWRWQANSMVTAGGIGRAAYLLYVRHFCKHCIYLLEIMRVTTFYDLWLAIGFGVFVTSATTKALPMPNKNYC